MHIRITKIALIHGGTTVGEGDPMHITDKTGSSTVEGDVRMWPPVVGDRMVIENSSHPGGGIVTSRLTRVIDMGGGERIVTTANSVYEIEEIDRDE